MNNIIMKSEIFFHRKDRRVNQEWNMVYHRLNYVQIIEIIIHKLVVNQVLLVVKDLQYLQENP